MEFKEEDFLMLSGLEHFKFCRRQWALIHVENQWNENLRTVEGRIMHERVHDADFREKRGDLLIVRDMRIFSRTLGVSGNCDAVEFHRSPNGIELQGEEGKYLPYPVEYKHGVQRSDRANELQLCCQAMCLEEMLCCNIPEGALFFGETRRREKVSFTPELREEVRSSLAEMHQLFQRGYTPKVKPTKSCKACSLKDICVPKLMRNKSVDGYLKKQNGDML